MKLSISEAARRAGVRRQALYEKMSSGQLSRETNEEGKPVIDLSELARVYPAALDYTGQQNGHQTALPTQRDGRARPDSSNNPEQSAVLQERIAALLRDNERLERDLERARSESAAREGRSAAEIERLLDLLEETQRRLAPVVTVPPSPTTRPGFWARLTGRRA